VMVCVCVCVFCPTACDSPSCRTVIGRQFRQYRQEDAHEFLVCLLDQMQRCSLGERGAYVAADSSEPLVYAHAKRCATQGGQRRDAENHCRPPNVWVTPRELRYVPSLPTRLDGV
jgi:hypothetical protein